MIVTVVLAFAAAIGNAVASVLQRRAARRLPADQPLRPRLLLQLLRQPVWWGGIGGVIVGGLLQAAALWSGELAVVQPVLAMELPLTLLFAALVFRRPMTRRPLLGTAGLTAGIVLLLVATTPSGGRAEVSGTRWLVVLPVVVAGVVALGVAGRFSSGAVAAALLGSAAAVTFALTAALMKDATARLSGGPAGLFTSWQLYATCLAGVTALLLLQNAYHAGTLVAAQPAVTVGDGLVSIVLSVALFGERIRTGGWLVLALVGVGLIVLGAVELSRSPLVSADPDRANQEV
jgi:drug/metabolite transporter (DMT)-like permease